MANSPFPGELKRGLLMKQSRVLKSWKEHLFVLHSDRISLFERESGGKIASKPKRSIVLAEVFQCISLPRSTFSITVGDPSAPSAPIEYVFMAASDGLRQEWVTAVQQALCRPMDAAQALQSMLSLQKQGALCSRAQELLLRWLGVGSVDALRQAKTLMEICRSVRPVDRCGDRIESLMVDLAVSDTEKELLAVMQGLTLIFIKEYAPPGLRDRLVAAAMLMYERSTSASVKKTRTAVSSAYPASPGGGASTPVDAASKAAASKSAALAEEVTQYPWTPRVQQEFGLVLHAIAVFDHAEHMRQEAAARQVAARREAESSGQAVLTPIEVTPDSDDFGLFCEDTGDVDCYSQCSCECEVCSAEERAKAEAASVDDAPTIAPPVTNSDPSVEDPLAPLRQPREFADDYELGRRLGEGAYSTVYQARNRITGEEVAVKVAPKERLSPGDVRRLKEEVTTIASLRHPNIVCFIALYEDETHYRIVTELMSGGELFDQIVSRSSYGEREACEIIRMLARVIAYLHSQGIVHRDIKPENLLLAAPPPLSDASLAASQGSEAKGRASSSKPSPSTVVPVTSTIKLADFGFAKRYRGPPSAAPSSTSPGAAASASPPQPAAVVSSGTGGGEASEPPPPTSVIPATGVFSTSCGTPSYVAPEILRGDSYGAAVDLWSLGILAFILLSGYAPFSTSSGSQPELFRRIMSGRFSFDPEYWSGISSAAKDLITQLLRVDPNQRATASDVLRHPWILGAVSSVELSFTLGQMRLFQQRKREILRCGFLVKQGAFVRNFKRRFFVLTSEELVYYEPDDLPPALLAAILQGGSSGSADQQLQLRWVSDLKARPRGSIRLQGVSVEATKPVAAASCPRFPVSVPATQAAPHVLTRSAASSASVSARVLSGASAQNSPVYLSSESDSPGMSSATLGHSVRPLIGPGTLSSEGALSALPVGAPARTPGPEGALSDAAPSATAALPTLALAGRDTGVASSISSPLVPCTPAGEYRWGLCLSSPPSLSGGLTGRNYVILADSEAARDVWVTAISTVHLRGDLVRRAGVAMAMGDQHVRNAVGLMQLAQDWQDTVMAAPPQQASASARGVSPGQRRKRQSRHPAKAQASAGSDRADGAMQAWHAKACKHASSAGH